MEFYEDSIMHVPFLPSLCIESGLNLLLRQGTNAHTVICEGTSATTSMLGVSALWRHSRFWHAPSPNPLLHTALATPKEGSVIFSVSLSRATLAFFGDCIIQEEPSLPIMALLEMASSAGRSLKDDGVSKAVAILGAVLPSGAGSGKAAAFLECRVLCGGGDVTVMSRNGADALPQLTGQIGCIAVNSQSKILPFL